MHHKLLFSTVHEYFHSVVVEKLYLHLHCFLSEIWNLII